MFGGNYYYPQYQQPQAQQQAQGAGNNMVWVQGLAGGTEQLPGEHPAALPCPRLRGAESLLLQRRRLWVRLRRCGVRRAARWALRRSRPI